MRFRNIWIKLTKLLLQFGVIKSRSRKKEFFDLAWQYVEKSGVRGDYFEFGVYYGESFSESYRSHKATQKEIQRKSTRKKQIRSVEPVFWAFDSFAGLPEPLPAEQHNFKKGDFCGEKRTFLRALKRARMNQSKVEIIDGWYEDTLTPGLSKRLQENGVLVAIAYLDCDIYESTLQSLLFLDPFLQPGSLIGFDDYFALKGGSK